MPGSHPQALSSAASPEGASPLSPLSDKHMSTEEICTALPQEAWPWLCLAPTPRGPLRAGEYKLQHAAVAVHLQVENTRRCCLAVTRGECDLAIVGGEMPCDMDHLLQAGPAPRPSMAAWPVGPAVQAGVGPARHHTHCLLILGGPDSTLAAGSLEPRQALLAHAQQLPCCSLLATGRHAAGTPHARARRCCAPSGTEWSLPWPACSPALQHEPQPGLRPVRAGVALPGG